MSSAPAPADRAALLAALDRQIRAMSAQAILLSQAVADRLPVNSTDLECLDLLVLEGPLTAGRLAERSGLTTGAITGVIDRLERAGYARRVADPADRRRVIVEPRPEGVREIAPLYASLVQAMQALYARYSDQELATILDFTARAAAIGQEETARLRAAVTPQASEDETPPASGHVLFSGGVSGLAIVADPTLAEPCRARVEGAAPEVRTRDGSVTVRFGRLPAARAAEPAVVALSAALPWRIEVRGGAARLTADLRGLTLRGIELSGGVHEAELTLPRPLGTVAVRVSGGASTLVIHRPAGAAARTRVSGGAASLALDGQRFPALSGHATWESPDYAAAADRYEIDISGGVHTLTVDTD